MNQLADETLTNGVVNLLRSNRIALTTLLRGAWVDPNFKNIIVAGRYLDANEARRVSTADQVFNWLSDPDEQNAFENLGAPGKLLRLPNLVFGKMAYLTNGIFCPLQNPCVNGQAPCNLCADGICYEDADGNPSTPKTLRACARPEGQFLSCAPSEESVGNQAARCVSQTLGGNPYILVD
jgi:hypothetical protein